MIIINQKLNLMKKMNLMKVLFFIGVFCCATIETIGSNYGVSYKLSVLQTESPEDKVDDMYVKINGVEVTDYAVVYYEEDLMRVDLTSYKDLKIGEGDKITIDFGFGLVYDERFHVYGENINYYASVNESFVYPLISEGMYIDSITCGRYTVDQVWSFNPYILYSGLYFNGRGNSLQLEFVVSVYAK